MVLPTVICTGVGGSPSYGTAPAANTPEYCCPELGVMLCTAMVRYWIAPGRVLVPLALLTLRSTGTPKVGPLGSVKLSVPARPSTAVTVAGKPPTVMDVLATVEKAWPVSAMDMPGEPLLGVGPPVMASCTYCSRSL